MKKLMSMSWLPLVAAALILSAAAARAQESKVGDDGQDRFIGAWRLVWLEEPGPDGNVHRADCTGMFVFTRDGHASVQVMYRNPQAGTAGGPVPYAQGGYEATFGRYDVDPTARTFTYHVEGALVRSLIGKDLVRSFELSGNQLIVKSSNPNERWRVAWEHY
jgi:lipocalin-like protein